MIFRVEKAMVRDVLTIGPEESVDAACTLMLNRSVSGLPVVDKEQRLVGIITERDVLRIYTDAESDSRTVADYMNAEVFTVSDTDSLTDVAEMFLRENYRRVPVVRDGKLVGVISRRDLIRFIVKLRARVDPSITPDDLTFRTQQQMADHVGVSVGVIRRKLKTGELPSTKVDGQYRVSRKQLNALAIGS